MSSNEERLRAIIPADFHILSASPTNGNMRKDVGASTAALLKVLHNRRDSKSNLSWVDALHQWRTELQETTHDGYILQLSSSHRMDIKNQPIYIVPPNFSSGRCRKRRAILIGIGYQGQVGELSGCHDSVNSIKQYLMEIEGFAEHDILVLVDNASNHHPPTRQNLVNALSRLAKQSNDGDVVFLYYAGRMGRGGRYSDKSGTNIQAPAMVPLDAERGAGPILSDDFWRLFVKPMRSGVTVTMVMDCVLNDASSPLAIVNLPYRRSSDDSGATLHLDESCVQDILTRHGQPSAVTALCLAFLGGRRMGPNMQAMGKLGRATNG